MVSMMLAMDRMFFVMVAIALACMTMRRRIVVLASVMMLGAFVISPVTVVMTFPIISQDMTQHAARCSAADGRQRITL